MHIKQTPKLLLIFLIISSLGCDSVTDTTTGQTPDGVDSEFTISDLQTDGQYIVVLKESALNREFSGLIPGTDTDIFFEVDSLIDSITESIGLEADDILYRYRYSIKGFTTRLSNAQVQQLRDDDRVDYLEKDGIVQHFRNNPLPAMLRQVPVPIPIGNTEQSIPYGVTRTGGPFDGTGLTAWIIDTGVDLNHNDLNVDINRSTSFVLSEPTANDLNGHGTHVAGTIAAIDNDIDVVGVAAGAAVVGVKVLSAIGFGTTSAVIAGIDYVAEHADPGDVANLSLGGSASNALDEAVHNTADLDILFAIAAGNDSRHAGNYSPARVEHENSWTVSAIDQQDVFASFSNYGNPPIRFAAPGVNIESLWIQNGTHTISGTSMAAPHVAGILLVSGGEPESDGTAINDPYGDPDPIVYYTSGDPVVTSSNEQ